MIKLAKALSEGILAFPATAFRDDGAIDADGMARHVATLAAEQPAALVPIGGAGEIFSVDPDEYETLLDVAIDQAGDVPVIAGVGHGLATARRAARAAERLGAPGILLFPPYLTTADQAGLAHYVGAVCETVGIGVIAYSRNNGIFDAETALRLAERHPNFLGVKDGVGDFETILKLKLEGGDRFTLINGVPTAEILAAQCFAVGVTSYSSAVFTFLPAVAKRFYRAVRDGETEVFDRLMREFYLPLVAIRNRRRGYAVSIVKAGLRAVGEPAGPVRAPLMDLTAEEMAQLEALIATGRRIVAEAPAPV
nr:5-dehydro-4-deoxyglucarate dehydratase [Prosthecomicrobium pneumaticum]